MFADVDPDPDAVLAEFGVESPADLVDGETAGAHDAIPDDRIDADDETATELFAGLEDAVDDTDAAVAGDTDDDADDATATASTNSEVTDEPTDAVPFSDSPDAFFETLEGVFVGSPTTTLSRDGDAIDSSAAELSAVEAATSLGSLETASADRNESTDGGDSSENGSERRRERERTAESELDAAPETGSDATGDATTTNVEPTNAAPTNPPSGGPDTSLTVPDSSAGLELVGEPTRTRISDDAFGAVTPH
ncbi:hypothetical protein C493_11787 [Natronolimnohabitans innermongolicus JCM 12255]|uniref:Uncharacterized protein n=1 Tax=Natronolimnohabitans innermongolicus JCM 12255 TaxID=1227499 RepID=L9X078_9EURY|nr:hypothetical protein C493_11787 [Natronolimnohabitans innermongolicus JCM 12255]